jgi:dynein heavy chain
MTSPAGKGYGGRSVLPDNLKALFRPCAMMVPDYALIANIELLSFGFSEAPTLSVKVVASLKLSSEQLSSQDHYDFGMRAVKSILNACGKNLRQLQDWAEPHICLKALNDVNLPKFTSNDIPLYKGITSDLFPNVELMRQDYAALTEQLVAACKRQGIQPVPIFIQKCIELYETLLVRHGLMVFGDAYAGKSKVIETLQEAMSNTPGMRVDGGEGLIKVETYCLNPKSITMNQLYGVFNLDTQEWSDGVLAIKVRDCAESPTPNRKWIVADGPVDPVWVESMNTVLDDNKKLCLNSGQIIKLKPQMTIMLQTDDLQHASPATISRCGMVLVESALLGHNVHIQSYCDDLRTFFDPAMINKIEAMWHYLMDVCAEYVRVNCRS